MNKKLKSNTLCKQCKKETYNENKEWSGFCSKECEKKFYRLQGKRNKAKGARFELKVRKDLEENGYIVTKWMNNVETGKDKNEWKLIPAKPGRFRRLSTGFPDYLVMKRLAGKELYEVRGIECKTGKYLSKEEKEKCEWYLKNNIFPKIFIASPGKERGTINYKQFGEKNEFN